MVRRRAIDQEQNKKQARSQDPEQHDGQMQWRTDGPDGACYGPWQHTLMSFGLEQARAEDSGDHQPG